MLLSCLSRTMAVELSAGYTCKFRERERERQIIPVRIALYIGVLLASDSLREAAVS